MPRSRRRVLKDQRAVTGVHRPHDLPVHTALWGRSHRVSKGRNLHTADGAPARPGPALVRVFCRDCLHREDCPEGIRPVRGGLSIARLL